MAIVRVNPFRAMDQFARGMQRTMQQGDQVNHCISGNFTPRIDVSEDEKMIFLSVELPGISKEEVGLSINDENILIIKGEKKRVLCDSEEEKDKKYIRAERSYGTFNRSFLMPENINADSIKAAYRNGILDITIEKKEPEKPKSVSVTIE
jgi:HSP20 family protein